MNSKHEPLIILDFSHTSMRMLHSSVSMVKPKMKDGMYITEEFIDYWEYLVFNSLQAVKRKFKGELLLAIDGQKNWRKDFYKYYKNNRIKSKEKSKINFDEFYPHMNRVIDTIDEMFPYKVLGIDEAEADDIAGVLCQLNKEREIILVTSDHDWAQTLLNKNIKIWDPIKLSFAELSEDEKTLIDTPRGKICKFTVDHILRGDSGDNVPGIKDEVNFTPAFKQYLKDNNKEEYIKDPRKFHISEDKDDLIENYDVYKKYLSGAKKGQNKDIKDIYEIGGLGATKSLKFMDNLNENLKENLAWSENFNRNNILVNFNFIPDDIKEKITKKYNDIEMSYNSKAIYEYFKERRQMNLLMDVHKFYDPKLTSKEVTSLDDFF